MDRVSDRLGPAGPVSDTAWGRIVLHGDRDRRQRPENSSYVVRAVVGVAAGTSAVLMRRPAPSRAWVARDAAEPANPLGAAPRGQRQEDVVAPSDRPFKAADGVGVLLTSPEAGRTFVAYTPRDPPRGGDPGARLLPPARERCLPYACYRLEPGLGPMSVRVGTLLPFTLAVFLNGPAFLARELTRLEVGFRKDDNAILAVDALAARADQRAASP